MSSEMEAVVYGVPVYRVAEQLKEIEVGFFKVDLNEKTIVNAYKYLIYKFGQYLLLKKGIIIKDYDPLTGTLIIKGATSPDEVVKHYEEFIREYLVPKLKERLVNADIDKVLSTFYYKSGESKETGLSAVVLTVKHVQGYFEVLTSRRYAIQSQAKKSIEKIRDKALRILKDQRLKPDDVVIVMKKGDIMLLTDDKMIKAFTYIPKTTVIGVKRADKAEKPVAKNKEKRTEKRCIYCGSLERNIMLLPATGKLGVGRIKLPHETITNLSRKAQICLRCVLVSLFYVLDSNEDLLIRVNWFITRFRSDKRTEKEAGEKKGEVATLSAIFTVLERLSIHPRNIVLLYNSLFGDDRVTLRIEGLDEEAFEKLALLYAIVGTIEFDDDVQSLLISYVNNLSFSDYLRILLHILKKQSEKVGVSNMSYVSKYITSKLYAQRKDKRVAYALAKLADAVVYIIDKSSVDNKDYVKRRFADTLRRAGLSRAVAYAMSATNTSIKVLTIPVRSGEEKEHIKRVLDEYSIKYEEEEGTFKVYIRSIPEGEIKIEEEFTPKIYEDVYTYLVVINPTIEVGKMEEESTEVSESV